MESLEPERPRWILRTTIVLAVFVVGYFIVDYPSESELRQKYRELPPDKRRSLDESIIQLSDLKPEESRQLDELRACFRSAPACSLTSEQLSTMRAYEQIELQQSLKRARSAEGTYEPIPSDGKQPNVAGQK